MYSLAARSLVGSASVRPKHRPCSTAFSWASRAALFARGDLALHPGLESTARAAAAVGLRERALSPLPCRIKQAVKHIDISLLLANSRLAGGIGLTKRHIYWYTFLDLELAC